MKNLFLIILSFFPAVFSFGDSMEPVSVSDWAGATQGLSFENGVFSVDGRTPVTLISKKSIRIHPDKKYQVSGWIRKDVYATFGNIYLGAMPIDDSSRQIMAYCVLPVPGTDTVLLGEAEKGAKTLWVKDASHWKPGGACRVVFYTKKDCSDLPNFRVSAPIARVGKKENGYEVFLSSPLAESYPAGTPVREHSMGSNNIYCATNGVDSPPPNFNQPGYDWMFFSGEISGRAVRGNPMHQWWPGTMWAKIILHVRDGRGFAFQFKNVKIEEIGR